MRSITSWLGLGEQEPIKYEITKVLPYSQKNFYSVICDVDDYDKFVPYMTNSYIMKDTIKK